MWGKNLVKNLAELGVLDAVADAVEENQNWVRENFPSVTVYQDSEELIQSKEINAVAIATPPHTHHSIAKSAMEAGLDVFVEKPVTLDPEEARSLEKIADAEGRVLMVGHLLLYQPAISFLREAILEGKIGKLRTLHQRRSKLGRVRSVENVLWSFGVHDVAVILYLAGAAPKSVSAFGHDGISKGIEDDTYLHLAFEDGMKASLHNSWFWPRVERELIVTGEKGILVFDELNHRIIFHDKTVDEDLQHHDEGEEVIFEGSGEPLRLELEHFLDCCRSRNAPISDGRNGFDVVSVLHEAEKILKQES